MQQYPNSNGKIEERVGVNYGKNNKRLEDLVKLEEEGNVPLDYITALKHLSNKEFKLNLKTS